VSRYTSTITQRGQVTLPAEVRRELGVKPRDRVEFTIDDGKVTVRPVEFTATTARRSIKPLSPRIDIEEQIRIAKEERAEQFARKLQEEQ
jgi:antitoxin PrlF